MSAACGEYCKECRNKAIIGVLQAAIDKIKGEADEHHAD